MLSLDLEAGDFADVLVTVKEFTLLALLVEGLVLGEAVDDLSLLFRLTLL